MSPAAPPDRDEVEVFLTAVEPFLSKGAISAVVLNGTALRPAGNVVSYPELALPVRYAAARCRSAALAPERTQRAQREIGATAIGVARTDGDAGPAGERPADGGGAASLVAGSGLGA